MHPLKNFYTPLSRAPQKRFQSGPALANTGPAYGSCNDLSLTRRRFSGDFDQSGDQESNLPFSKAGNFLGFITFKDSHIKYALVRHFIRATLSVATGLMRSIW